MTSTAATLPHWNLADLYQGPDDPSLKTDLGTLAEAAKSFSETYSGTIAGLSGADLGAAIATYENLMEQAGRIISFAQLWFATRVEDPEAGRFHQTMQEKITDINSATLFFTLEINRLADDALNAKMADPAAARFAPWVRDLRVFRDHQLSDDLEKMLTEKSVTGSGAWTRLFEETIASLRFDLEGKQATVSEALVMLSDKDPTKRQAAGREVGRVLGQNGRIFSLITNTLAKDKEIEDRWRHYPRPVSARNRANLVEDEVVDALVSAVQSSYDSIAHRYYALKARWMGQEKLSIWDRNAPLPEDDDAKITWGDAKSRVLNAYGAFDPKMRDIANTFFDKNWIDAEPRAGKDSGAFAHPTVPSAHPYVMMNYHGKTRDVMTLAHELGHGVHQVLASEKGYLLSDTPLTLAETASVFGEMLTFRSLLDAETDPGRRRVLLAGKVEDMINTVVRQTAFFEFERRLHDARRDGELSSSDICGLWLGVQKESLGPVFDFDDGYEYYWSYIPHFIHTPFYVYAYAFGDCLVNALYDVFQSGHPEFQKRYLEMLQAGGTLRHKELLAPFGLDASDPAFWSRGLSIISGFIDELEEALPA
ncbi:MAG: M3 family oligoendopeptidase [Magnetospiraceae bacterium]